MLTMCGARITEGSRDYLIGHRHGPTRDGGGWVDSSDFDHKRFSPDFTDPATVGCLLALVYEAHKGGIIPASRASQWFRDPAALVAALEAAS